MFQLSPGPLSAIQPLEEGLGLRSAIDWASSGAGQERQEGRPPPQLWMVQYLNSHLLGLIPTCKEHWGWPHAHIVYPWPAQAAVRGWSGGQRRGRRCWTWAWTPGTRVCGARHRGGGASRLWRRERSSERGWAFWQNLVFNITSAACFHFLSSLGKTFLVSICHFFLFVEIKSNLRNKNHLFESSLFLENNFIFAFSI